MRSRKYGGLSGSQRFISAILLALLAGCQTWQPTTMSLRDLLAAEAPSSLRVTRTDGAIVTIRDPSIRNDSIVTMDEGPALVMGVPTGDIGSLEVRRFSRGKTFAFIASGIAVTLAWARAVTGSSGGTDTGPGPLPKDPG